MNLTRSIATALLVMAFGQTAHASCVNVDVQKEGATCRAYVTNNCGRPLQCFVDIVGYTSAGQSYRETGTVNLSVGERGWYGIGRVAACGNANAQCQNRR